MSFRAAPLGAMIVAASAGAQTIVPDQYGPISTGGGQGIVIVNPNNPYGGSGGVVVMGSGNDTVQADSGNNTVIAGSGSDHLYPGVIVPGSGGPIFNPGNTMGGGAGSDILLPGAGYTTLNDGADPSALPEPASWGTMILGFGMIGAGMRRRRDAMREDAAPES